MREDTTLSMLPELEIFILTYNRHDLLKITVESIVRQTIGFVKLTIIDNGSKDNTSEILNDFKEYPIKYIKNESNRPASEVYDIIKSVVRSKYIMVFHDDDIMHKDYIRYALETLMEHGDLVLVGSVFNDFTNNTAVFSSEWEDMEKPTTEKICLFEDYRQLAGFFYDGNPFHFASAIYRTDFFKINDFKPAEFGKICDRPFLLDVAKHGKSLVFNVPFIQYRVHANQDSWNANTGPYFRELSNLQKMYHSFLGSNPFTRTGKIFLQNNFRYMQGDYLSLKSRNSIEFSRFTYYLRQYQNHATSVLAVLYGIGQSISVYISGIKQDLKKRIKILLAPFIKFPQNG